jgi:hypothetical protein
MRFRGRITDEFGEPLWGAHVVTVFRDRNIGVTTDENGFFIIPEEDRRSDETWKLSFIGFQDRFFNIPARTNEQAFTLKENANELNEVVVTAQRDPIRRVETPHYSPVVVNTPTITTVSPTAINNDLMARNSVTPSKSLWEQITSNKALLGGLGLGALLFGLSIFGKSKKEGKEAQGAEA